MAKFLTKPRLYSLILFIFVMTIISFNRKYYIPSAIRISGTYSQPVFLNYFWDSGNGYNKYEENNIWLGKYVDFEYKKHSVEIGLHPSSGEGKNQFFRLNTIFLSSTDSKNSNGIIKKNVQISGRNPLKMNLKFSHIRFSFKSENPNTKIQIKIDNLPYNLILPESQMISLIQIKKFINGKAINNIKLPRLKIYGLKLRKAEENNPFEIEQIRLPFNLNIEPEFFFPLYNMKDRTAIEKKYIHNSRFHPTLFAIQLFISTFIAWLFYELILFIRKMNPHDIKSYLRLIFIENERWIFWILFLSSFSVYLFWLLGQWPGEMNWDTFVDWRKTQTLEFDNNRSFIYLLILSSLKQLFNSPAVMAFFQILITSFLIAWIFFFAYTKKANRRWLFIFYIFTVISIPIAINTIFINTTTLFALLTVFWAFYLFRLNFYKSQGKPLMISKKGLLILAFMFFLLVSIRHNAIIYIIVLPPVLYMTKGVSKKSFSQFITYFVIILLGFYLGVASILDIHNQTDYKFRSLLYKVPAILYFFSNLHSFKTKNLETDQKILQKVEKMNRLSKDYLQGNLPAYYSRLKNNWVKNEREVSRLFYRSVLKNIPLYLSYRAKIFFATLGLDHSTQLYYLKGYRIEKIKRRRPLSVRGLINQPINPEIRMFQNSVLETVSHSRFLIPLRLIFWNNGIPLLILLSFLIRWKHFPLTAGISAFILIQVILLFFVIPVNHWRFFYFIYLSGFLVLPLYLVEMNHRKDKNQIEKKCRRFNDQPQV